MATGVRGFSTPPPRIRTAPGWTYGFPELAPGQGAAIAGARRVSNPGCYATGAIAILRPLVDGGLVPPDHALAINAVSGYSGGGRQMIEDFEAGRRRRSSFMRLGSSTSMSPEIMAYSGDCERGPYSFRRWAISGRACSSACRWRSTTCRDGPRRGDLEAALAAHYAGCEFVRVVAAEESGKLEPQALNGTNDLEIRVFANEARAQAVIVARLDNLGKGASGAAVQNLQLMLGL